MSFIAVIGVITSLLPVIGQTIGIVEKLFGSGKGKEKKDIAIQLIEVLIKNYEGFRKEDILNEKLFAEGIDQVVEGIVKVANSRVKR